MSLEVSWTGTVYGLVDEQENFTDDPLVNWTPLEGLEDGGDML